MKFTFKSSKRLRTRLHSAGSLGPPQIPSPVIRMAPKPRRFTVSSPAIEKVPAAAAFGVGMRDWIPRPRARIPEKVAAQERWSAVRCQLLRKQFGRPASGLTQQLGYCRKIKKAEPT